jgi:fumarylacetoacetate (FAA) hydrolase
LAARPAALKGRTSAIFECYAGPGGGAEHYDAAMRRLVTYATADEPNGRLGLLRDGGDGIVDVHLASREALPASLRELLRGEGWLAALDRLPPLPEAAAPGDARLLAALPDPVSVRDFYGFERHVRDARRSRGLEMVPEWYEIPVFYFSNALAVRGPEEEIAAPPGSEALDFELEVGIVIGRGGRDISAERAFEHVAGLLVLNDWSARDLQAREMKVGLGPGKGKDFALGIGPWMVPLADLAERIDGERVDLAMRARLNGEEVGGGNLAELHHGIPRMIAHASAGVELRPGELLGTGTVGGGCLTERGPGTRFLQPGDVVELEVEALGVLRNRIVSL